MPWSYRQTIKNRSPEATLIQIKIHIPNSFEKKIIIIIILYYSLLGTHYGWLTRPPICVHRSLPSFLIHLEFSLHDSFQIKHTKFAQGMFSSGEAKASTRIVMDHKASLVLSTSISEERRSE